MRLLKASEIECRVNTLVTKNNETSCSLLLYKDARVDMRLLDEVYGQMNWKRTHEVIDGNLYCTISVWDESKREWVGKQDVGTESFTEKEKGQASDSFKRAGFNWGIGRELYTAPVIWVKLGANEVTDKGGKKTTYAKFVVSDIGYNDQREINRLVIKDARGNVRYAFGTDVKVQKPAQPEKPSNPTDDVDELRQMAYSDISRAKTKEELMSVWNNYGSLQSDKEFVNAMTAKKTAIKNGL